MNYARALRLLRATLGISQQDLAEKTGLSKSLISRIEAGERSMSEVIKKKIASSLDIPVSTINLFSLEEKSEKIDQAEIQKLGAAIIKLSRYISADEKKFHE